jgi:hypothetical protein
VTTGVRVPGDEPREDENDRAARLHLMLRLKQALGMHHALEPARLDDARTESTTDPDPRGVADDEPEVREDQRFPEGQLVEGGEEAGRDEDEVLGDMQTDARKDEHHEDRPRSVRKQALEPRRHLGGVRRRVLRGLGGCGGRIGRKGARDGVRERCDLMGDVGEEFGHFGAGLRKGVFASRSRAGPVSERYGSETARFAGSSTRGCSATWRFGRRAGRS